MRTLKFDSATLAQMPDHALRNLAWQFGCGFADWFRPWRTTALKELLDEATRRPAIAGYWVIASLRDASFSMEGEDLRTYLHYWMIAADQSGGLASDLVVLDAIRLISLLDPTDERCILLNYVRDRESELAGGNYDQQLMDLLRGGGVLKQGALQMGGATGSQSLPIVTLIVPPFLSGKSFLQPPLGFLLLATRLRETGFDPRIFDMRVGNPDRASFRNTIRSSLFVVVCTTPYDQVQNYFVDFRLISAMRTVDQVKAALPPNVPVIVCGSHGTIRPDLMARGCMADYVVRGEYEDAILNFAVHLRDGGGEVKHVYRREDAVRIKLDPLHCFPTDIARTQTLEVEPAYDLIKFDDYFGDGYDNNRPVRRRNWATLLANRGCPFTCNYCFNFWGRNHRKREVGSVIDEMELLERKHGVRHIFIIDFTFTVDRKWVTAFCEEYRRRNLTVAWVCETRTDVVDKPLLVEMARSGCQGIWFGVESFVNEIVALTGKQCDSTEAMRAIETARAVGIDPHVFIMIGLPGETLVSLNENLRRLRAANAPYTQSVIVATPRYGTDYYRMAQEQYPDMGLDKSFFRLNAIRGQVNNELSPFNIQNAISLLQNRDVVFGDQDIPLLS